MINVCARFVIFFVGSAGFPLAQAAEDVPTNVYWGDTHVHTSRSMDAGRFSTMVGPEEAYRYAKGEAVRSNQDTLVRMIKPLDFLVVADHAEYAGLWDGLRAADPLLQQSAAGRRWQKLFDAGEAGTVAKESAFVNVDGGPDLQDFPRTVWERNILAAEQTNQPGLFTAFIGYEFSSMPDWNNLHRVVIFKDGAARTKQVLPFSSIDSVDPEDLWQYMDEYEKNTGGNVLAIPHNSNISDGLTFALRTYDGEPLTNAYAKTRSRWEPLIEITQLKGDSETHPILSPNDEYADYRTFDKGNMIKKTNTGKGKSPSLLPYEYARSALKLGLNLEADIGTNPFKFGVIGSTDSHTGLTTIEGRSYVAKHNVIEQRIAQKQGAGPSGKAKAGTKAAAAKNAAVVKKQPQKKTKKQLSKQAGKPTAVKKPAGKGGKVPIYQWTQAAGGLAAVWAPQNSRDALFEAMERRETYATTGSRMNVRFFGGWKFQAEDAQRPDLAQIGYSKGVPMGGDLTNGGPRGAMPSFLVRAVKDPRGANLDRIQIVKGWLDSDEQLHEKVYNVALSDGRSEDADGKVKPVGNTVDVQVSTYVNSIGDPELSVVWTDPDFNRKERAFYYTRVLEIPTPRWTDRESLGIDDSSNLPTSTVERAYTSPIWYTP